VVEVAVRDEDRIEILHLLQVVGGLGVVGQPGIYDDVLARAGSDPEGRVAQEVNIVAA
jgi:hypothetical protein